MGKILKIEKSTIAIKRVNQCRLFLQVNWLSEMTDTQGNAVLPEFLEYKGTHTNTSKQFELACTSTSTTEIMGNMEKTDLEEILIIKTRLLGNCNTRRSLRALPPNTQSSPNMALGADRG
jgi:hypothetical protein